MHAAHGLATLHCRRRCTPTTLLTSSQSTRPCPRPNTRHGWTNDFPRQQHQHHCAVRSAAEHTLWKSCEPRPSPRCHRTQLVADGRRWPGTRRVPLQPAAMLPQQLLGSARRVCRRRLAPFIAATGRRPAAAARPVRARASTTSWPCVPQQAVRTSSRAAADRGGEDVGGWKFHHSHRRAASTAAAAADGDHGDDGDDDATTTGLEAPHHHHQPTVFVGISGGVDSSVAALLLKDQGYDVVGVHMTNWDPSDEVGERVCTNTEDLRMARRVCKQLGIPLRELNFVEAYWNEVFEPCLGEFSRGRTPNPDMACNSQIKFGHFLRRCEALGADFIATGHYAQVAPAPQAAASSGSKSDSGNNNSSPRDGGVGGATMATTVAPTSTCGGGSAESPQAQLPQQLLSGVDDSKDQAYFLCRVPGAALQRALFPLGGLTKAHVREIARERGLCTADRKDSYGICFVGKRNFPEFLSQYVDLEPGDFVTPTGEVVGQHGGVQLFTIGQGARISGAKNKYFVAAKDSARRTITVVEDGDPLLNADAIRLDRAEFSWVSGAEPAAALPAVGSGHSGAHAATAAAAGDTASRGHTTLPAYCRVRHQGRLVQCEVTIPPPRAPRGAATAPPAAAAAGGSEAAGGGDDDDERGDGVLIVRLALPTRGVAEGQVLALHSFDDPRVCLGGGTIVAARRGGTWSEV